MATTAQTAYVNSLGASGSPSATTPNPVTGKTNAEVLASSTLAAQSAAQSIGGTYTQAGGYVPGAGTGTSADTGTPTPTTTAAPATSAGYQDALATYLKALKGSDDATASSDSASLAARRKYSDLLNASGGTVAGAQQSASVFERGATNTLADLGLAEKGAAASASTALERVKYEQGLLPKAANNDPYTLSPGQTRFDAQGNKIAGVDANAAAPKIIGSSTAGYYSVDADGNLSQVLSPKPKTTSTSVIPPGMTQAGLSAGEAKLQASKGPDGYVDPTVYQQAFEEWPGTTAQFLAKFPPKNYVNPANTWLPSYLMPPKAKATTRTI